MQPHCPNGHDCDAQTTRGLAHRGLAHRGLAHRLNRWTDREDGADLLLTCGYVYGVVCVLEMP
jgi:hypothetical protein